MHIEILPTKEYTATHGDDEVRVTLVFFDDPVGRQPKHEYLTLSAKGWNEEDIGKAIAARYPDAESVTFRLPERVVEPPVEITPSTAEGAES
jgi:hypothetical protein